MNGRVESHAKKKAAGRAQNVRRFGTLQFGTCAQRCAPGQLASAAGKSSRSKSDQVSGRLPATAE